MKIAKIFDKYELRAQYFPAILASTPAFIVIFILKKKSWFPSPHSGMSLTLMENFGLSIVGFFFLMQLQRFLAKYCLEKKLFGDTTKLPTAQILLFHDGTFSREMKVNIRKKVLLDFNIDLPGEEREKVDKQETGRLINEAVALIRTMVKDGRQCINYNIQYGFFRNLIAGFFIALPLSLFSMTVCIIYPSNIGMALSLFIAISFTVLFLARKVILTNLAGTYAKNLFIEYLSLGDK